MEVKPTVQTPQQQLTSNNQKQDNSNTQQKDIQQAGSFPQPFQVAQRPKTPDDVVLKPDQQALKLLALIINRLRILERNIAYQDDLLRDEHIQREAKLSKINSDMTSLYSEYKQFSLDQADDQALKALEQRIKVEIDYNLVNIMENKLKMDQEHYVLRKKIKERTDRMRELQVMVYGIKQENKDLKHQVTDLQARNDSCEKEVRRLKDIVYSVTSLNLKPEFGMDSNQLIVPKYKGFDQYILQEKRDQQQQKYFLDNQTHKFGRQQHEVLKDGIWQAQLSNPQSSKHLLQSTGKLLMSGPLSNGQSLGDLMPDSWINNKYMNTIHKPKRLGDDTLNDRETGSQYQSRMSSQNARTPISNKSSNKNYQQ